jgi:hypothetical protein
VTRAANRDERRSFVEERFFSRLVPLSSLAPSWVIHFGAAHDVCAYLWRLGWVVAGGVQLDIACKFL